MLWSMLPEGEGGDLLDISAAYGCPSAVQKKIKQLYTQGAWITGSELNMLASFLAAFAVRGSWRCLVTLLDFLSSDLGEPLRSLYAPAMLRLLNKLADAGWPDAVAYQGVASLTGVLYPESLDKAERLFKRACELGSAEAPAMYAAALFRQAESTCSAETKASKLSAARVILEDYCPGNNDDLVSRAMLGYLLVLSDDDADFAAGMAYLDDNISQGCLEMVIKSVTHTLDWSDNQERYRAAVMLLNRMVRRNDSEAIFLRGRCYIHGGLSGKQDREKGLKMLHQAAGLGYIPACLLLGELYLFGLFRIGQNTEKALEMLQEGMSLGSSRCSVLYAMAKLHEFPVRAEATDRDDILNACKLLKDHYSDGDNYMLIACCLMRTGADNVVSRIGLFGKDMPDFPVGNEEFAEGLATLCLICQMTGNLGPLVYIADALKRIASTKYAQLYADKLSEKVPLLSECSCTQISEKLENFIRNVPRSFVNFRSLCARTLRG